MEQQNARLTVMLLALFSLIVIALYCGPAMAAGADDAAIDKVRLDFNAAFNAGNAEQIAQIIDDGAIWLPFGKATLVGKEKITTHYANYFSRVRARFELKPGVIVSDTELAVVSGDFTRSDTPKASGTTKRVSGHYLLTLKKQADGSWKIIRDIWSETAVKAKGKQ